MKVIWLASWYPNPVRPYDGDFIQRHARAVSLHLPVNVFYLDQSGHKFNIPQDKIAKHRERNLTERIIFFSFKPTGFSLLDKLWYNVQYFRTYRKMIRSYIRKKGKPDLVHVHVPMKAGLMAQWILKTYRIPYIVSEQSGHYQMGSADDIFKKSARHIKQLRSVFRNAVAVTNVSAAVGSKLESIFNLPPVKVIHNTVDTSLFHYQQVKNEIFRFIHVSTLNDEQKNIRGILAAISQLSRLHDNFELILVGPASESLKQEVINSGIDKWVRFTGEIPYNQVAVQMQHANAFVLFSRYENFPCVIVEALCCGLPVVASDVGGISEALNESNGILVQKDNVEELCNAMASLLQNYSGYNRVQISRQAQGLYSYETIGSQFAQLYESILSNSKSDSNG